jgi:hypothetical protein
MAENLSSILKEEQRLRAFENKALGRELGT